ASSQTMDKSITLPPDEIFRNLENAKRFAIDIGGSLTKLAYYSTVQHKVAKVRSFDHSTREASSDKLYEISVQEEVTPRLHFIKFENAYIETCLDFIKDTSGQHRNQRHQSHRVDKEDEMTCLIKGCNFVLKNIPREAFVYAKHADSEFRFQTTQPDIFPYLLVNIGSGVSIVKVESEDSFERIGGTLPIGGGTFWGLQGLCSPKPSCCSGAILSLTGAGPTPPFLLLLHKPHPSCCSSTNPTLPAAPPQTPPFLLLLYKPHPSCCPSTNPTLLPAPLQTPPFLLLLHKPHPSCSSTNPTLPAPLQTPPFLLLIHKPHPFLLLHTKPHPFLLLHKPHPSCSSSTNPTLPAPPLQTPPFLLLLYKPHPSCSSTNPTLPAPLQTPPFLLLYKPHPSCSSSTNPTLPAPLQTPPFLLLLYKPHPSCSSSTNPTLPAPPLQTPPFLLQRFDELLQLASRGQHTSVDMLVKDIYGGSYASLGLTGDLIASSFGKSATADREFSKEDMSKSLLHMISNDIGQLACLYAKLHNLSRVYFGGFFIPRTPGHHAHHHLQHQLLHQGKGEVQALFLRHEGYLGAIGAFLKGAEKDNPNQYSWGENYAGSSGLLSVSPDINPMQRARSGTVSPARRSNTVPLFDMLEMDRLERQLVNLPLLQEPSSYVPDTVDLTEDALAREYWLDCFEEALDGVVKRAVASQPDLPEAAERAQKFRQKYRHKLQTLRHQPFAYGSLTVRSLLDTREHCLNEFNFPDPYSKIKQRENDVALRFYLKTVVSLEQLSWEQRQLALVSGLLAGNVFDWGAKAVSDVLESDPEFGFEEAKRQLEERPWLVDTYEQWLQRLKGLPHKCALFFVDNSGVDIILGVMPFVRELLLRGTEVRLQPAEVLLVARGLSRSLALSGGAGQQLWACSQRRDQRRAADPDREDRCHGSGDPGRSPGRQADPGPERLQLALSGSQPAGQSAGHGGAGAPDGPGGDRGHGSRHPHKLLRPVQLREPEDGRHQELLAGRPPGGQALQRGLQVRAS
ncbi:unnamed protein product, partial [Tetraodon nigroviridis]